MQSTDTLLQTTAPQKPPTTIRAPICPEKCHDRGSCERHRACMYFGCANHGLSIGPAIKEAHAKRAEDLRRASEDSRKLSEAYRRVADCLLAAQLASASRRRCP